MDKIKLGDVEEFEVFAKTNGFDIEFEVTENDGGTNHFDNLVDLADDIFICAGQIGYYRLKDMVRRFIKGEDPEFDVYEKEILGIGEEN